MSDERDYDLDEEVEADRQLRNSSLRDSSRSGEPPRWTKPDTAAEWPCRNGACRVRVEVTADALEQMAMFNRILRERGEPEITESEVVVCDACRRLLATHEAAQRDKRNERTTQIIRALKQSGMPRDEHELLAELRKLHHPDVPGLLEALDGASDSSKRKRRVSGL